MKPLAITHAVVRWVVYAAIVKLGLSLLGIFQVAFGGVR